MTYLQSIFKSKFCWLVFAGSLAISYQLIPKQALQGNQAIWGIAFAIVFALSLTCLVRNIKEKTLLARASQGSFLGAFGSILGLAGMGSLQACGISAPVCGATISVGIASSLLPTALHRLLSQYATAFIVFSLLLQLASLYWMRCFKKVGVCNTRGHPA